MAGKYDTPPPLPHETLNRVLRIATIDGRLLLFVAGSFAILSAYTGDAIGAIVGCCAAGAGALELNGVGKLENFVVEGIDNLIRSQLLLLGVLWIYVGYQLANFNLESLQASITPEMRSRFSEMGIEQQQYVPILKQSYYTIYVTVGLVTLFYQGGLALYFRRHRETIARALSDPN